jgi:acetyl-CoA C-acetyltransferase
MSQDNTPIIIGVGQITDRLDTPEYRGLSNVELAAEAGRRALADAVGRTDRTGDESFARHVEAIGTMRTFEDSVPRYGTPFGKSNNFPNSVAKRLGITPKVAVWATVGGETPQTLLSEFFERMAEGEFQMALIVGAEAISTAKHLVAQQKTVDWSESIDAPVDDRGQRLQGISNRYTRAHKIIAGPDSYGLLENARRARLKLSRQAYAREMGALFAPFSAVAAENPYSTAPIRYSPEELSTVTERNRMVADPYTRLLVSRDQVNQAAAVLITTVGTARKLGVDPAKWVYLHGYAKASEPNIMQRENMGVSMAARLATSTALGAAGIGVQDLDFLDLYSCFPIAVFNICDGLNISTQDPRGLTVTGGLPYFGGPGNSYSMHGIASMVEKLRAKPGSYGLVGANGGQMSKYAAGVYSTRAREFRAIDSAPIQARVDAQPEPTLSYEPQERATIETYTIVYGKGGPSYAIVVGRLPGGERFLANTQDGDEETLREMVENEPLGRTIFVRPIGPGNRFAFSQQHLAALFPPRMPRLRDDFEFIKVERRGHLLEVTINRPEQRNSLHPPAHEELDEAFSAFFADPELWVAIITGAGTESFCSGNDLKWGIKNTVYIPKAGFGGLTMRGDITKPIIAAVNGFCVGGGLEIAMTCHLVVADSNAKFGLTEVKVGVIAGQGGLIRLPRRIPKMIAMELILTGKRIGAEEARTLGLVSRITPPGEALEGARALAAEILEGSPTSVRISLEVMRLTESIPDELAACRMRQPGIDELLSSEDSAEGALAFAQKRKPNWKNR